jgi:hypothetical protein
VTDFLLFYAGQYQWPAFNVADSAVVIGSGLLVMDLHPAQTQDGPCILRLFHLSFLHTYGVLVALAFLAGLWIATHLAKREGLNADAVTNLVIYCALAAIAGAKLMMFLVDPRYRENPPRSSPLTRCARAACSTAA